MGMTIEDNIDFLNEAKKLFEDIANNPSINETVKTYFIIESLENAIDTMRKYQMFQDQSLSLYMERLKADMVAMLTEIQLEFEEGLRCKGCCNNCVNACEDIPAGWFLDFIDAKINSLKENTDGTTCD